MPDKSLHSTHHNRRSLYTRSSTRLCSAPPTMQPNRTHYEPLFFAHPFPSADSSSNRFNDAFDHTFSATRPHRSTPYLSFPASHCHRHRTTECHWMQVRAFPHHFIGG